MSRRSRAHRQCAIRLLIFDAHRSLRAHTLHGEIEFFAVVARDVVVVDASAQELARAGSHGPEYELLLARRQAKRRRTSTVDDAHDECLAPAVIEELLDRITQQARLPKAAEYLRKLVEAADGDGAVDWAPQCAADEGAARCAY